MVAVLPYTTTSSEGPCSMLVENHQQSLHVSCTHHRHDEPLVRMPSSSSFTVPGDLCKPADMMDVDMEDGHDDDDENMSSCLTSRRVTFATNPETGSVQEQVHEYECSKEDRAAMYSAASDVEYIQSSCRRIVMIYRSRSDYMKSLEMLYSTNPLVSEHQHETVEDKSSSSNAAMQREETALRLVSRCSSRGLERQIYKNIKKVRRSTIARILECQALYQDVEKSKQEEKLSSLSAKASARDKYFALKLAVGDYREAKRVYDERVSSFATVTSSADFDGSCAASCSASLLDRSDHSFDSFSSRKLTEKYLSPSLRTS